LPKSRERKLVKAFWDRLANDLQINTMSPLLLIFKRILSLKVDDFKSPAEYITKMDSFFEEQGRLVYDLNHDMKILLRIHGLSQQYRELVDRFKNFTRDQ
jgi:gag-polypeptide of LTR copia-type